MLTCKCPEGATTRETHPGCCRWRVVRPFLVQYRCDTFVHYRRECRPGELAIDPLHPGPLSAVMFVEVVKLDWNTPPMTAAAPPFPSLPGIPPDRDEQGQCPSGSHEGPPEEDDTGRSWT